jgi:hypothetical protein
VVIQSDGGDPIDHDEALAQAIQVHFEKYPKNHYLVTYSLVNVIIFVAMCLTKTHI